MVAAQVFTHRTEDVLAHAVAARLVTALTDAQSGGRVPSVVLTGGGIAGRLHRAVADSPAREAVDWGRVEVWWGDERFAPQADPERNSGQARAALLDHLPLAPELVHPMPASDGPEGADLDAAAQAYAAELAAARPDDRGPGPLFDVVMLGVGPDGHVASLFPGQAAVTDERVVVPVPDSPKPPPQRVSLTLGPLNRAREVWFLVSGEAKARAVRLALTGSSPTTQIPASGVAGTERTLWFLDDGAAAELPSGLAAP